MQLQKAKEADARATGQNAEHDEPFLLRRRDTLLSWEDIFHHLCAAGQDHKVAGTDTQMGPFVYAPSVFTPLL